MAGTSQPKSKLNKTLCYIVKLLYQYSIVNWFIAYGTLLGIVRNNSCIHGDDDIDIVCDKNDIDKIKKLASDHGFFLTNGNDINNSKPNCFLRISKPEYAPIDFYCATIHKDDYNDTWENVVWKNASLHGKFVKKKWRDVYLQLPQQYISKLKNRYGKTWRIPNKGYKGTRKLKHLK